MAAVVRVLRVEILAPDDAVAELVVVFDVLDDHERERADERENQADDQPVLARGLGAPNAKGHGEAAENQYDRVQTAPEDVEKMLANDENVRVAAAEHRVGTKEAGEEEDFRRKEKPHAELTRVELLGGSVPVVV